MKFIIFGVIIIFVVIFLACAVLYPELVGIGGKKAKEIESSHSKSSEQNESE